MSDPFAPNSKDQLIREAQRGLAIVAILLAVMAYVVFDRMTDRNRRLPEHVRNAPIAQTVWPYANEAPDSASRHAARTRAREQFEPAPELARRTDFEQPHSASSRSNHGVEPAEFQDDLRRPTESANEKSQQPVQRDKKPSALADSSVRDFVPVSGDRLPPILKDKPYPHTGTASSDLLTNASNESFVDSRSQLEAGMSRPKQDNNRTIHLDSQLDPFESSSPQEKTAAVNQIADPEEPQLATQQSDFSPTNSQVQPAASNSTQNSTAINALTVRAPTLNAPHPIEVPSGNAAFSHFESAAKPPAYPGRTSFSNSEGSFDADSQLENSNGKLAPATKLQAGNTNTLKVMLHRVVEGESYYSIAQDYYGDGNYFRALSLFNQQQFKLKQFNQIQRQMTEDLLVGTEIEIPSIEQLEREFPNEVPKRTGTTLPSSTFVTSHNDNSLKTSSLNSSSKSFQKNAASSSNQEFSPPASPAENEGDSAGSTTATAEANYMTKQGETLFEIAANELGQASRYLEIMELNRTRLPERVSDSTPLPANLKLFIPK